MATAATAKDDRYQRGNTVPPSSGRNQDDITIKNASSAPAGSHPRHRHVSPSNTTPAASRETSHNANSSASSPRQPPTTVPSTVPSKRLDAPPVMSAGPNPAVSMDTKKLQQGSGAAQSRRKSGGSGHQLRSPVVKRPPAAPVTLQGWLHKQGSEGLMLWKKRWFVLSEYCLFYYKGQEEEKLLGSILLPSYKISPCTADDRVYRKFAFKAEHLNMRTYYFAADSRELMVQWMNALSLASILQEGNSWGDRHSSRPSMTSISSNANHSADDSDSGFHGYRSKSGINTPIKKIKNESVPINEEPLKQHGLSQMPSVVNANWNNQKPQNQPTRLESNFHQPLYANAPPKPKRMGGDPEEHGSASPDIIQDDPSRSTNYDPKMGVAYIPRMAQPQQPVYVRNSGSINDMRFHHSPVMQQLQQTQPLPHLQHPPVSGNVIHSMSNVERRTPDTYGRSNSVTPAPTTPCKVTNSKSGDYEDIYGSDCVRPAGSDSVSGESVTHVYRRPSGQVAYIKGSGPPFSVQHKPSYPGRRAEASPAHKSNPPQMSSNEKYVEFRYRQQVPNQDTQMCYSSVPVVPNSYHPPSTPQKQHQHPNVQQSLPLRRSDRHPPRPHSADFLEYDFKRQQPQQGYLTTPIHHGKHVVQRDSSLYGVTNSGRVDQPDGKQRLPRPKSSLDVMPSSEILLNDNYYWSEEYYAQKMRQSASYLQQTAVLANYSNQMSSRSATPSARVGTSSGTESVSTRRESTHVLGPNNQVVNSPSVGSVSNENSSVVLRHPKRTETPQDISNSRSPSRQQCYQLYPQSQVQIDRHEQLQQRRWSEYYDPRANGQFMRSASARLPRQKYQDDENDSQMEDQGEKPVTDVREGERKIQQVILREESMKRLLEWKQRMLQSPLTRKPSGSSSRGIAQNELSKYYKQQVLRDLANQENKSIRDEVKNYRRRSQQEDSVSIQGRIAGRSRSQDGRRSSVNRYNSYSSDDEELGDVRKARKRIRRPLQAGRSRHSGIEVKPVRRSATASPEEVATSVPDYENISISKAGESHAREDEGIILNKRGDSSKFEDILPDSGYREENYISATSTLSKIEKSMANECRHNKILGHVYKHDNKLACNTEINLKEKETLNISHNKPRKYPDDFVRSRSNSLHKSSVDSTGQDDRCSSGKHSDSGYDTLQAGNILPDDLMKVQMPNSVIGKQPEMIYPVHWEPSKDSNCKSEMLDKHDDKKKTEQVKKFEAPPKNIVQNRIREFETGKEIDKNTNKEALEMQEPLKITTPVYLPNEAHVSSLKNAEVECATRDLNPAGIQTNSENPKTKVSCSGKPATLSITSTASHHKASEPWSKEKSLTGVHNLLAEFESKTRQINQNKFEKDNNFNDENSNKRCVFSDTETLLYDTASDSEFLPAKLLQQPQSLGKQLLSDEDDDKDDEVAAVLGKKEKFYSSCRDLGRNRRNEISGERRRKKRSSKSNVTSTDGSTNEDIEVIVTPGYLRLSMAESMITHEDSDSYCSTPTILECSLREDSENNNESKSDENKNNVGTVEGHYMPMTPSKKSVLASPDIFNNTRSSSASHSIIMENIFGVNVDCEESSYVEMTEDGFARSLLAPQADHPLLSKLNITRLNSADSSTAYTAPDSPRYCEIGNLNRENVGVSSHYELICRSSNYEPVYMEVNPFLDSLKVQNINSQENSKTSETSEKLESTKNINDASEKSIEKIDEAPPTPPRTALPDILNSSSSSIQNKKIGRSERDSSDADDEASKDLDSLDTPKHPRFSLSDTFRPASYYLGATSDRTMRVIGGVPTVEQHDSSDSDLVPPPPIPTSPPPLDELDNSLDTQESSLEIRKCAGDTAKVTDYVGHISDKSLWAKAITSKSNVDNTLEHKTFTNKSSDITSSENESVELRPHEKGSVLLDRLIKRRPVSDETIGYLTVTEDSRIPFPNRHSASDLESIGSRSGVAMTVDGALNIDIDKYLDDLQIRELLDCASQPMDITYSYSKSEKASNANVVKKEIDSQKWKHEDTCEKSKFESMLPERNKTYKGLCGDRIFPSVEDNIRSPSLDHSLNDVVHYENLNVIIPPPPEHSSRAEALGHGPVTGDEMYPPSTPPNIVHSSDAFVLHGCDDKQAGAPYYYSDLLKCEEDGFTSSNSEKSVNNIKTSNPNQRFPVVSASMSRPMMMTRPQQTLNNQRGYLSETNLILKRNDIGRKVNPIHHVAPFYRSDPPHQDPHKLAEELRTTSANFIDATDKHCKVDERNLYEASTLQRMRSSSRPVSDLHRSQTPDFNLVTNRVNFYPEGLRDKSLIPPPIEDFSHRRVVSDELDRPQLPRRRSRSLEGLLDDTELLHGYVDQQFPSRQVQEPETPPYINVSRSVDSSSQVLDSSANVRKTKPSRVAPPLPKEDISHDRSDPWEEDSLWRESLRRVSLRHTRSLDNLDEPNSGRSNSQLSNASGSTVNRIAIPSGRHSVDLFSTGRQKLQRGATYVNDSVARATFRPDVTFTGRRGTARHLPIKTQKDQMKLGRTCLEGYMWDEEQEMFRKRESPVSRKTHAENRHFLEEGSLPPQPPPFPPSFEIDREHIRQWDLMSSAPLLQQQKDKLNTEARGATTRGVAVGKTAIDVGGRQQESQELEFGDAEIQEVLEDSLAPSSSASGSGSVIGRDPLPPRSVSTTAIQQQGKGQGQTPTSPSPNITLPIEEKKLSPAEQVKSPINKSLSPVSPQGINRTLSPVPSQAASRALSPVPLQGGSKNLSPVSPQNVSRTLSPVSPQGMNNISSSPVSPVENADHHRNTPENQGKRGGRTAETPWNLNMSAGELLGRTHEELVLLLIQLRRQSASICKSMEACHVEIEAQARLAELDSPRRIEHLQKLEELKKHLLDLEKQYEKGKPLVNLVDNMVKLGSLYRGRGNTIHNGGGVRERLEFNHKVQEQRLLAEEKKEWERLNPDHNQLQAKVQELYRLDRLLQEESGTLQSLQQDKEILEKALGGLRHKLHGSQANSAEAERYRKQQRLLEKELSRIRMLLAHNSKKLEETVAENARLEQELVVLRQKLQSPRPREDATSATAALEAELQRVQMLVGDLQRQRHELSIQVRQLTEKSQSLVQQIRPGPTGVAGAGAIPGRKRHHSTWLETDMDSLVTVDIGIDSPSSPPHHSVQLVAPTPTRSPLYVNTDASKKQGIIPREKQQEIKTVRIVKRESERRQRDRDRGSHIGIPITNGPGKRVLATEETEENTTSPHQEKPHLGRVLEEDAMEPQYIEDDPVLMQFQRSMSLPRGFGKRERLDFYQPSVPPPPPARVPSPRNDSVAALRNIVMSRQRVRFENGSGGSTSSSAESSNSQRTMSPSPHSNSRLPMSAHEQLFGNSHANVYLTSPGSSDVSPQLSPVFKSEAAKAIVMEMSSLRDSEDSPKKRVFPREKRRHHTVSSGHPLIDAGNSVKIMGSTTRSCDDLDMERALRPRLNAPDVVRSTMSHKDLKYNESTIDSILGTPNKIVIPERYIPEEAPKLSAEEQLHRLKKAEAIRKMLSETTPISGSDKKEQEEEQSATFKKKLAAEKKQREHILQLNQILAKQVMEKSKIVAGSTSVPNQE